MKKKILFRIGTLQAGGAERMLVDIINNLDTNLYEITLLLNVNYGIFLNEVRKDITYKYLYEEIELPFISNFFPVVSKIVRYLKDILYKWFPFLIEKVILKNKKFDASVSFLQDLANVGYKIPASNKIIWVHIVLSDYIKQIPSNKKYLNYLHHYNKIVTVSNAVQLDLENILPAIKHKIITLPNPINKQKILEKSLFFYPKEYQPFKEKLKIISVGRINYQKGLLRLVYLKKLLDDSNIDCELFILGKEDVKNYFLLLKEKIRELGVSIHFLGAKENPYPYIKNANIMVHPAIHEGYGLVIAESLILNTPVIATDLAVYKEFAKNEIFYTSNSDAHFPKEALNHIKSILGGERKGELKKTIILDSKEYIMQLNAIL